MRVIKTLIPIILALNIPFLALAQSGEGTTENIRQALEEGYAGALILPNEVTSGFLDCISSKAHEDIIAVGDVVTCSKATEMPLNMIVGENLAMNIRPSEETGGPGPDKPRSPIPPGYANKATNVEGNRTAPDKPKSPIPPGHARIGANFFVPLDVDLEADDDQTLLDNPTIHAMESGTPLLVSSQRELSADATVVILPFDGSEAGIKVMIGGEAAVLGGTLVATIYMIFRTGFKWVPAPVRFLLMGLT